MLQGIRALGLGIMLGLLVGCQHARNFFHQDEIQPISSVPLEGVDDFDLKSYRIDQSELSDQLYFFGFDQSELSQEAVSSLDQIAGILAKHPNLKARIEGHTDDLGSSEYNIALGWRRAQAVASVLESQGVSESQIEKVSYGKENPLIPGTSEEARAKNRRAFVSFSGSSSQ